MNKTFCTFLVAIAYWLCIESGKAQSATKPAVAPASPIVTQQPKKSNIELFRAIIERGFNQGDLSVADEVVAQQLAEHEYLAPTNLPGPEILKWQIKTARSSVTGFKLTIEDIVADGDKVWARMVAQGTEPRSGKWTTISVIDVCRFKDGKLVEHWGIPDRFAFMHQLGLLPEPPAGSR